VITSAPNPKTVLLILSNVMYNEPRYLSRYSD